MTPEHGSKSEDNCNLRSAEKEGRKIYSSLEASKKKKKDLLIHGSQQG